MSAIIRVSQSAIQQLSKIRAHYQKEYIYFGVKSGGCSGFQYILEPCDNELEPKQEVFIQDDVKIKICPASLFKVIGTEIDWQENIMGKAFVFNNPNANVKCGCGSSFG